MKKFQELIDISTKETKQISDMFKELANLKGLGFHLETESLQILLASNDIRTFMVYNNKNHPVAARIVHVNNLFATDIFAANSLEARKCGATYFIMQHIFETLKEEGFQTFDFGRIPPSNHATDSVYVFKNASRGTKVQYNGEWTFYKKKYIEILLLAYKLLKLKKQRY